MGERGARWVLACAGAAVLLGGVAAVLLVRDGEAAAAPGLTPDAGVTCDIPPLPSLRALPDAEGPPVLLWAEGQVRLFLDERPAFSAPEAPQHLGAGEHAVRLEAEGYPPLRTHVRIDAWTPALLHGELHPQAGLTLVRVGAPCTRCPPPLAPLSALSYVRTNTPSDALLAQAAAALRTGDWPDARDALQGIPQRERRGPLFLRLAGRVLGDAHNSAGEREQLNLVVNGALPGLLRRLDALTRAEDPRRRRVQLERWNRTAERYGALVARFGDALPRGIDSAGARLEALTADFERARRQQDVLATDEVLLAAEEALTTLVAQLRSTRPDDCAFQAQVVATVAG